MDINNKQEDREEEKKQKKNALDRVNQGINFARNARDAKRFTKLVSKKLKNSKQASRGTTFAGKLASKGAQAAIRVAAGTVEVWGPIALIVGFFALIIIIIIVIFSGVQPPPTCEKITVEPQTVSKNLPTSLSIIGCGENVTYSWILPQIGGVFSASQSAETSYMPPRVDKAIKTYIAVNVCFASSLNNCSQYISPEIKIANSSTNPDPGQIIIPPCNLLWDKLKSIFGVSVYLGDTSVKNSSCHQLQAIYRTYATSSKSSQYYNLLKRAGPFNIRVYNGTRTKSCSGNVITKNNIKLYVVRESSGLSCFYKNAPTPLLLHETGHQIRQNTQPLIMSRYWLTALTKKDKNCYEKDFIKSYSLRTTVAESESMAEATMLYVINSKTNFAPGSAGKPIYNFKNECPSTYNYIRGAVYGNDYEFN